MKLPLDAMGPRVRAKLGDAQAGEGKEHRGEGRAVDQEGPARADRGDGQAGDGRADHPGGVERGRVERHGIVQVGIADQFRDESLAHRRIEGGGAAEQEGEDVDVPELDGAGDGQEPQDQGETAHGRLGGDEELALVEMVGGDAGPGQQQELRSELQGHDQADRRSVVIGELGEHQPVLAGPLHPGADVGDEGPGCPDPIVEPSQGPEDARERKPHDTRGSRGCFATFQACARTGVEFKGLVLARCERPGRSSLSAPAAQLNMKPRRRSKRRAVARVMWRK